MVATFLVVGLVLAAAVTDVRRHKIYNWTTYPGMLAALGLNAVGEVAEAAGGSHESLREWLGCIGLADSLAGLAICGFAMLLCFVLFRIGGGDVKLMAMLGAFLGLERGVQAMLWTFVLGGCAGLILLIWRVGVWTLAARVLRQVLSLVRLGFAPLSEEERSQLQPPLFLAPCAVLAALIVLYGNPLI